MKRSAIIGLLIVFCAAQARWCSGKELLFAKTGRNYDWQGPVGQAYRRELEPRLFPHDDWRQRLYCETADAEANETIEVYKKPDGSYWLDFRRAAPALSPVIRHRPYVDQRVELAGKLAKIKISSCQVPLPAELVRGIAGLWDAMLPGVDVAPVPDTFSPHGPAFIAFARNGQSVKTGRICIAAYDTQPYQLFLEIIADLKRLCRADRQTKESLHRTLPIKLHSLARRLGPKTAAAGRAKGKQTEGKEGVHA